MRSGCCSTPACAWVKSLPCVGGCRPGGPSGACQARSIRWPETLPKGRQHRFVPLAGPAVTTSRNSQTAPSSRVPTTRALQSVGAPPRPIGVAPSIQARLRSRRPTPGQTTRPAPRCWQPSRTHRRPCIRPRLLGPRQALHHRPLRHREARGPKSSSAGRRVCAGQPFRERAGRRCWRAGSLAPETSCGQGGLHGPDRLIGSRSGATVSWR